MSDRQAELKALAEAAKGKTVLELGSAVGESTAALASTARIVHAVDWHYGDPHNGIGDTLNDYLTRCRPLPNVVHHIGRFEQVLPALALGHFEVIFIDGYHTYEQVAADIVLALPLLAVRGKLLFHDYGLDDGNFGVSRAVDERFTVDRVVHTLAFVNDARA